MLPGIERRRDQPTDRQSPATAGTGPAPIVAAPLVVHLIHQLGIGGLENGLVNLINTMPPARYRHAIICLTDATDFRLRIQRNDVEVFSLHKRPGKDWSHYLRLYRTLRQLKPDLVHTRNLGAIEGQLVAALAGVPRRIHGEHGREIDDLHGTGLKNRLLRRLLRPLVGQFVAVSGELRAWLQQSIGVAPARLRQIGNGVDSLHFHPRLGPPVALGPPGFLREGVFVIGSVGRMAAVKDYQTLVRAFITLVDSAGQRQSSPLRLLIAGDGPCRLPCQQLLEQAGLAQLAWLPGERDDIAQLMRVMDLFVLPSLAEGSSNTILEAMASGLPVVATAVGGNPDLVRAGWSGALVPPQAPLPLEAAMFNYFATPGLARRHGRRGRRLVLAEHSMGAMSAAYLALYDAMFAARPSAPLPTPR